MTVPKIIDDALSLLGAGYPEATAWAMARANAITNGASEKAIRWASEAFQITTADLLAEVVTAARNDLKIATQVLREASEHPTPSEKAVRFSATRFVRAREVLLAVEGRRRAVEGGRV